MIEKVNPNHPDKVADRIAGAIVDYCYTQQENPKCAIEVLIGHGLCTIIAETSVDLQESIVESIVNRIAGSGIELKLISVPQDIHLADNQNGDIRCGDNGIFKGIPITNEELYLSGVAEDIYSKYKSDGKYVYNEDTNELIICQSNAHNEDLKAIYPNAVINPLGEWSGGTDVDTGATNRKLGSDMGHSLTGGGLHGKDLSKADVCVNIYAWLKAQELKKDINMYCAIGDTCVNGVPYKDIVETAKQYITKLGGFEKLAEWGYKI